MREMRASLTRFVDIEGVRNQRYWIAFALIISQHARERYAAKRLMSKIIIYAPASSSGVQIVNNLPNQLIKAASCNV
jgi:hypothetical protein